MHIFSIYRLNVCIFLACHKYISFIVQGWITQMVGSCSAIDPHGWWYMGIKKHQVPKRRAGVALGVGGSSFLSIFSNWFISILILRISFCSIFSLQRVGMVQIISIDNAFINNDANLPKWVGICDHSEEHKHCEERGPHRCTCFWGLKPLFWQGLKPFSRKH